MPDIHLIDGKTVRDLLTMDLCIEVMGKAVIAATNKSIALPPRMWMPLYDKSGSLGLMPGSASEQSIYGVKVVGLHPDNPQEGRPTVQGFVALFEHETGAPVAIINAAELTAIRTAAVSGLATKLLARPDVERHGILGTGAQALTHAEAILSARPSVKETVIWGRDVSKAKAVADAIKERTGVNARATEHAEDAAACDVVTTVTGAKTPILRGAWLPDGAHINLVGSHEPNRREADTLTITRSSVFVDLRESALAEAGDLLIPIEEGALSADDIVGEIGAVAQGRVRGRIDADEVTLFKSLGNIAQDIYAADALLRKAVNSGVGAIVEF